MNQQDGLLPVTPEKQPWSQAAAWCAAKDVNLEEATEWAQRSIALQENFNNLRVKALLLQKRGDVAGAQLVLARADQVLGDDRRLPALLCRDPGVGPGGVDE